MESWTWWQAVGVLAVVLLWGVTNPLMKRATHVKDSSSGCLWRRLAFMVPLACNQLGSALFILALVHLPVSVVVPCVNSLVVLVTALVGQCLGERAMTRRLVLGTGLVMAGVAVCLQCEPEGTD